MFIFFASLSNKIGALSFCQLLHSILKGKVEILEVKFILGLYIAAFWVFKLAFL